MLATRSAVLRATTRRAAVVQYRASGRVVCTPPFRPAATAASFSSASASAPRPSAALPGVNWCFIAEAACLASPEKLAQGKGGEDAYFVSKYAAGVADGVGGYAELGVDSGNYSRAMMANIKQAAEAHVTQTPLGELVALDPRALLDHAHRTTAVPGGTTACVLATGADRNTGTSQVQLVNLGDSGLLHWRHTPVPVSMRQMKFNLEEAGKLWELLLATRAQTHYFNCPYQMEYRGGDRAERGDQYVLPVQPGDLLIMMTDGVLDNLFMDDIKGILARFDYTPCHTLARMKAERAKEELQAVAASASATAAETAEEPKRTPLERFKVRNVTPTITTDAAVAEAEKECRAMLRSISTMLAFESQKVGASTSAKSPFAEAARKEGYRYAGGKLDDSTVVAALVLHDDSIL